MRRTRKGYVVCRACLAHVRLAAFNGADNCPFCGTPVTANGAGTPTERAAGAFAATRGGLLLAALFGVSACGTEDTSSRPDVADTGADISDIARDTGADISDIRNDPSDVLPELPHVDVYGLPPDVRLDTTPDDVIPDTPPVDMYGLPADVREDDGGDAEPDGSGDAEPLPEPAYGIPPEP